MSFPMSAATSASLAGAGVAPRTRRVRGTCRGRRHVVTRASKDETNGLGLLTWLGPVIPQGALVTGVKGTWKIAWQTMVTELAPQSKDGEYRRPKYAFDGKISNHANAKHPPRPGWYVLYVGNACPWCHRVTLTIALLGLQESITVVKMTDDAERASRGGWVFETSRPDPVFKTSKDLREVYDAVTQSSYQGRCTAPLLVDGVKKIAVNNESADICAMLDSANFHVATGDAPSPKNPGTSVELRPDQLVTEIDTLNDYLYKKLNNAVYRSGFATTQAAHNRAAQDVVDALDRVDEILGKTRFLLGDRVTDSDVRLFPTIVRFDAVYASLFKCSSRRVGDLPHLQAWMRDFYLLPGVKETVDVDGYRSSYFGQLFPLNPGGIIPTGPTKEDLGLGVDPGRGSLAREDVFYLKQ